jgi:hypothetical protein
MPVIHYAGERAKRLSLLLKNAAKVRYDDQPPPPSTYPNSQLQINPLLATTTFPDERVRVGPCLGWPTSTTVLLRVLPDRTADAAPPDTPPALLRYAARHRYAVCEFERMDQLRSFGTSLLRTMTGLLSSFERVLWVRDLSQLPEQEPVELLAERLVQQSRNPVCEPSLAQKADVLGNLFTSAMMDQHKEGESIRYVSRGVFRVFVCIHMCMCVCIHMCMYEPVCVSEYVRMCA